MAVRFISTHTESSGTAIVEVIPAMDDGIPTIDRLTYVNGATAHTCTVMRPVGSTVTTATSLSGVSTLTLSKPDCMKTAAGADETLAANDYVVWFDENGKHYVDTVSSISGSTITLSNALTADVDLGATVWALGELGRGTHTTITLPASTTTEVLGPIKAGYATQTSGGSQSRSGAGDVLVISINNATNAGTLQSASCSWGASDNVNV